MKMLLGRCGENPKEYLMPIITRLDVDQRNGYRNVVPGVAVDTSLVATYGLNYSQEELC